MTPAADGQPVQMQVLYWGLGLTVAIVTALWKAAVMRGDLNHKWNPRVNLLEGDLTHKAIGELSILRRKIDELIGGGSLDPTSDIVDPAELLKSVRMFDRLISARRRARRRFDLLLKLGNLIVLCLLFLLVGTIAGATHLSGLADLARWVAFIWGVFALGLGCGVVMFFLYWYLQHKLSDAEILARPEKADG